MGQVKTIQDVAVIVGRGRVTVQRWLKAYTQSGITGLLSTKKSTGRPPIIKAERERATFRRTERTRGIQKLWGDKNMVKSSRGDRSFI